MDITCSLSQHLLKKPDCTLVQRADGYAYSWDASVREADVVYVDMRFMEDVIARIAMVNDVGRDALPEGIALLGIAVQAKCCESVEAYDALLSTLTDVEQDCVYVLMAHIENPLNGASTASVRRVPPVFGRIQFY